ncbi:YXWGXW repeat-containing protein [Acidibrevibacterium fodinaquatile]|uniref:YXWGXW repeat-containing protein n=1 Tax=Acidibrevibacterium fodinaquatile TaxID=1969806 RepID=UPI0013B35E2B|nr:YXWGXW repeat-containing protein [Acidibrevibacterium fodinaquatile]
MNMPKTQWRAGAIAGFLLALLAACAATTPVATPPFPPVPPPRQETMPKPPVSEQALLWQPGHWDWNGHGYDWIAGKWVPRDGHSAMWMEGYWKRELGAWVWVPGHWT